MLEKEGLLTRIWNLERVQRPGLIVEEIETCPSVEEGFSIEDTDRFGPVLRDSLNAYHAMRQDRDDNIPALSTELGTYVIPTAFGARIREFEDGRKYLAGPLIHEASDVDKIRIPSSVITAELGEQIRLVEYFVEKTRGKYPLRCPDIQNPLGVAAMLWESNDFFVSLLTAPTAVHKLLCMVTEVTIEYISRLHEVAGNLIPMSWPLIWAPPDKGIYLADDTMSMVSPTLYEEYGVQYNSLISREFGGLFLHSCTTHKRYFESIMKNEGLRSMNFAAQYSSDMKDVFEFFGGKVVVLPHYCHTDHPQIGTLPEFINKVLDCWAPERPAIIYVTRKPEGGLQQEIFDTIRLRGFDV